MSGQSGQIAGDLAANAQVERFIAAWTVSNTAGNNAIIRPSRYRNRSEEHEVMPDLSASNDRRIDREQGGRGSILIRGSVLNRRDASGGLAVIG